MRIKTLQSTCLALAATLVLFTQASFAAQYTADQVASLSKLAAEGKADAQNELAFYYYYDKKDYKSAHEWWLKAAQNGSKEAQYELAVTFMLGEGTTKSCPKTIEWMTKAATNGSAMANTGLADFYATGQCVTAIDYPKAMTYYKKGVELGDTKAMHDLGIMYNNGEGIPKDETTAYSWFKKAADKGYAKSYVNIGMFYLNGVGGVTKDQKEAAVWFQKAVDANEPLGYNNMGYLYLNGFGVTKDIPKAIVMFEKGAEMGDTYSLDNIIEAYDPKYCPECTSSPASVRSAYKWAQVGILRKNQKATTLSSAMQAKLSAAEAQKLTLEANNWVKAHPDVLK